jgi:uncharacterized membrane protein YczE
LVDVGVLVDVSVLVGVGVNVGPNNCPGPHAEITMLIANKLTTKHSFTMIRIFVFICPFAITGAPGGR